MRVFRAGLSFALMEMPLTKIRLLWVRDVVQAKYDSVKTGGHGATDENYSFCDIELPKPWKELIPRTNELVYVANKFTKRNESPVRIKGTLSPISR